MEVTKHAFIIDCLAEIVITVSYSRNRDDSGFFWEMNDVDVKQLIIYHDSGRTTFHGSKKLLQFIHSKYQKDIDSAVSDIIPEAEIIEHDGWVI